MLPIDLLINALLASKGVRNMMVQFIDYNEDPENCPITETYLREIKHLFPSLQQSYVYSGVICSLTSFTDSDLCNDAVLGRILGYPCCDDYGKECEISFHVNVRVTDGTEHQLFANVACDKSHETEFAQFVDMANKIINEHLDCISSIAEKRVKQNCVYYFVQNNFSAKTLIKSLTDKTFNRDHLDSLANILGNLFSMEDDIVSHIDFANSVHVGIIIGLLATDMHNPLTHFYPLPSYNRKDVHETMNAWGREIVSCLDKTKKTKIQDTWFSLLVDDMKNYDQLNVCVNGAGTIEITALAGSTLLKHIEFNSVLPFESLSFSVVHLDGWKLAKFKYNDDYDVFYTRDIHHLNITRDHIDLANIKMYSRTDCMPYDIEYVMKKKLWTNDAV